MIFKKVGDDTFFGIQINGSVSWLENMRVTGFHGWGKQRKKVIPNLYEFVKSSKKVQKSCLKSFISDRVGAHNR